MNDSVPEGQNYTAWIINPRATEELVNLYTLTNAVLEERRPVRELRQIYEHYARALEIADILHPTFVGNSIKAISNLRAGLVKAMLHRINCCNIRILCGIEDCMQLCCCKCVGAPKNIACTRETLRSFSRNLPKQRAYVVPNPHDTSRH